MARNKDYRETIRDANNVLLDWEDAVVVPETIEKYRDKLEKFYSDAGKNVKNREIISTHVQLSIEQEEELMDIAEMILADERADYDTYVDFLEDDNRRKQRETLNVTDIDSAVKALDILNDYSDNARISAILDSDQVVELYNEGYSKGMTDADIEKKINKIYNKTGYEGNALYEKIWNSIQRTRKKK